MRKSALCLILLAAVSAINPLRADPPLLGQYTPLPASGAEAPHLPPGVPYVLKANDQIAITVREHPELSLSEAVRPDGKIAYDGQAMAAAGRTADQLKQAITAHLSTFLLQPDVNVTIQSYHQDRVYVVGAVREYGPFPYSPGMSAQDAVSMAGGADKDADLEHVSVERSHHTIASLDLLAGTAPAFRLQPDDIINVARAPDAKIAVVGVVTHPGTQPLLLHEKLLDALTTAGITTRSVTAPTTATPSDQEADLSHITLTRGAEVRTIDGQALLEGNQEFNVPLQAGDVIYVPPAARVTVVGTVQHPGAQSYAPNERLLDAVTAAGISTAQGAGITLAATGIPEPQPDVPDLAHVTLTRDGAVRTIDLAAILKGVMQDNVPLKPGDVIFIPAERGSITVLGEVKVPQTLRLTPGERVLDALNYAGGATIKGDRRHAILQRLDGTVVHLNLEDLLKGTDTSQNVLLQDGDVLTVPLNKLLVAVLGEVNKPGVYDYKPEDDILQATLLAGGTTSQASLKNVSVIRYGKDGRPEHIKVNMEQMVRSGNLKTDQPLMPGDVVYVPTKGQPTSALGSVFTILSSLSYLRVLLPAL